jgi:F-type H+-transporting ATPase subunit epsilon
VTTTSRFYLCTFGLREEIIPWRFAVSRALDLEIVTPEGRVFRGEISSVVLPGCAGELGVLPGHAATLVQISPGELRFEQADQHTTLVVGAGLAEITGGRMRVLTEMAVDADSVDEAAAAHAIARAQEAMKNLSATDDDEIAAMAAIIQNATAQIHVKRRRRHAGMLNENNLAPVQPGQI